MAVLHLTVVLVSGKEAALPDIAADATLNDLVGLIEVATRVPSGFLRLLHGDTEVSLSDVTATLISVGICNGACLSVLRTSFPSGVFESKSSRSRNINAFFGADVGDVFQETEHFRATFNLDGRVVIQFKAEYDTGFQIAHFEGELYVDVGTDSKFQARIYQTAGNWQHSKDQEQHIIIQFADDASVVTCTSESTAPPMPFKDRVWGLQRVSQEVAGEMR